MRAGHSAARGPGQGQLGLAGIARGGSLNLVGALVTGVGTLGVMLLVTHRFSKPAAGAFFTATSAFLVIEAVASIGTSSGLVYYIARLRALDATTRIPAIIRAAIIPVAIASLLAGALLWGFALPLAHALLSGKVHGKVTPAGVATALRALAVMMLFAAELDALLGATRGYRAMRPTVMVDKIGRQIVQVAGVLVAALLGSTALLVPLWALPYLPAAIVAWLWLRRLQGGQAADPGSGPRRPAARLSRSRPVRRTDPQPKAAGTRTDPQSKAAGTRTDPQPKGGTSSGERGRGGHRALATATPAAFWRFTTPRAFVSLLNVILQRFDIVLVAIIKGPAWAAVYTAASGFLVAGQIGNTALGWATQPRFTELFTLHDQRGANRVYQATTAWLILLTWPLFLLTVVDGKELLGLFGHSYRVGGTVVVILGLSMLLSTACGQVSMVLFTAARSSWNVYNGLAQVIVNVGLDLWLIPWLGITGAAIGWAAAIAVGNLVPLAQLAGAVKLHPFGRGTLIALIVTTVCFGVFPFAVREAFGSGLAPFAVSVAGGCLLLLAGLWRFRGPLSLASLPGVSALSARLIKMTARA